MDGVLHTTSQSERQAVYAVPLLERRRVELELQLAQQQPEREQSFRSSRKFLHFPGWSRPTGVLFSCCLVNCPFHPPSIFPISSILSDKAMYFLSSNDFVSHSIIRSILTVSIFLMANRTYGCFSAGERKLAIETASILSTNKLSTRKPRECLCSFGSI